MRDHRTPSGVAAQRAVLSLALDAHPNSVTVPALTREIETGSIERAVRDLVAVGLLESSGTAVRPTAAAIHFDRLGL